MPTFDTPDPIVADLQLGSGRVQLVASDRTDTVVEVHQGSRAGASDRVRVDLSGRTLTIRSGMLGGLIGGAGAADVTIELPSHSILRVRMENAEVRAKGVLAECRVDSETGEIELDRTGPLVVHLSRGSVAVGQVAGAVSVRGSRSAVSLGVVEGAVEVRNGYGDIRIGRAVGDAIVAAGGGEIAIDHMDGNLRVRTAHGAIRLGEISRGTIDLANAEGDIEIGIPTGTAAWVDARSSHGAVHNDAPPRDAPPSPTEKTAEVRARTQKGTIRIHPAAQPASL
jgi:hypothetical protein